MSDRTDEARMGRYTAGDFAAFGELFHRYGRRAVGHFMRRIQSEERSADLLRESRLRIQRFRNRYDAERTFSGRRRVRQLLDLIPVEPVCLLVVVFTLLMVVGAGTAIAHEAHRTDDSAGLVASESERASEPDGPIGLEPVEPAAIEPTATAEFDSSHHAHHSADSPSKPVSIVEWLGRLHPMAIHFPIGLFLAAFVAEVLYAGTREELFRHALRFTLWGGAMSAVIAAPLGWMFAATGATEEGWLLEAHRWVGTAAAGLGVAVLWIGERTERENGSRTCFRVSLAVQALLIGSAGFLGGSLLYGFDHLWRGIECCLP